MQRAKIRFRTVSLYGKDGFRKERNSFFAADKSGDLPHVLFQRFSSGGRQLIKALFLAFYGKGFYSRLFPFFAREEIFYFLKE